jgi:hypothetical protein
MEGMGKLKRGKSMVKRAATTTNLPVGKESGRSLYAGVSEKAKKS